MCGLRALELLDPAPERSLARRRRTRRPWRPALRDLRDRYLLVKELAADRLAVSGSGTVGLADADGTARVERLVDPAAKLRPVYRVGALAVTVVSATLLVFL